MCVLCFTVLTFISCTICSIFKESFGSIAGRAVIGGVGLCLCVRQFESPSLRSCWEAVEALVVHTVYSNKQALQ